jgi:glycosyltransferase involved in cell wall biosynthesis
MNEAYRMRAIELNNARTANVTLAISDSESRALLELDPHLVVKVIPNLFDIPSKLNSDPTSRRGALFVGGFRHTPNVDAVLWFVKEIWPEVAKERADMTFCVAGSNPTTEILALHGMSGIEIVGYVPDLTDLFNRSRVFVAPLRFGAGVKGKIGQSMIHGLPIVATSIGAEGMDLHDGEHLLIADTPEAFGAAVLRLAEDDALWRRLQLNARTTIQSAQSIQTVRASIEALFCG